MNMAKLLYHMGSGTYFDLADDVYLIDTEEMTEPIDAELMDAEGDEIAIYWGRRIIHIVTTSHSRRRITDIVTESNNERGTNGID